MSRLDFFDLIEEVCKKTKNQIFCLTSIDVEVSRLNFFGLIEEVCKKTKNQVGKRRRFCFVKDLTNRR